MEKLAYIQTIENILPINGADNIVEITFKENGWTCIAKKDNFNKNDKCVFIEIDSIVPETDTFEFLRKNNFRVNTMKLNKFGVISQGLALPFSEFPNIQQKLEKFEIGTDITELLGVKKYSKSIEPSFYQEKKPKIWWKKWWWIGKKYFYKAFPALKPVDATPFPSNIIPKTDEENIQNLKLYFEKYKDEPFIYTEKLEGTSITMILDKKFQVCSRKWNLLKKDNLYWPVVEKEGIQSKMEQMAKDLGVGLLAIQGEFIGKPQENYYELSENAIHAFIVEVNGKRLSAVEFQPLLEKYGIKTVPILGEVTLGNYDLQSILKFAEGPSIINKNKEREGLVFSMKSNPKISFKVVSNIFRVQKGE